VELHTYLNFDGNCAQAFLTLRYRKSGRIAIRRCTAKIVEDAGKIADCLRCDFLPKCHKILNNPFWCGHS
jgi:hypothetical protein